MASAKLAGHRERIARTRQGPAPRRGVLLLVVLSILVLFVLAAVTFIVVAERYRRAALHATARDQTGDNPRKLLDGAMYQLVRDTGNTGSSLRFHSLLADLYGNDGFRAAARSIHGSIGQHWSLSLRRDTSTIGTPATNEERAPYYYSGCVLSMVSGAAAGLSARMVPSDEYSADWTFPPASLSAERLIADRPETDTRVSDRDVLVVNGRAFNGTGFGYDAATGNLDLANVDGLPVALLPHFKVSASGMSSAPDVGGADESWDAVDYQNMFLAMVPPGAATSRDIIPSFHRPELVNYWRARLAETYGEAVPPNVLRRLFSSAVLRPTALDHPQFTGSNPAYHDRPLLDVLVGGPWDIDNDGDGVPDSIWVDLGYPDFRHHCGEALPAAVRFSLH